MLDKVPQNSPPSLPEALLKLIAHRKQDLQETLSSDLKKLPDLSTLKDLDKAAVRIISAIHNNEKIGIYGDYDVDGTASCALFHHFFKMLGDKSPEIVLIQPSRFIEGYGLHLSSIEEAIQNNIKVLITVDCGITSIEAANYAHEKGLCLIITDHHRDAAPEMPNAFAVVNPNRRDEDLTSPLCALAGVGVAFAVCLKVKLLLEKENFPLPTLYPLLQFVALGTICDLAYLNPMNLKLVRHGLKQLGKTQYPGLAVFIKNDERKYPIPSEKLSFFIGPMINSKGRLDHAEMALNTLIADSDERARECVHYLEVANNDRKFIQGQVFESAKKQILSNHEDNPGINVAFNPEWHEGVIGIVASKLVETFLIPAIVFTRAEEGKVKASARTAGELNLFDALNECSELFIKFGGHKAAAGLTMLEENLGAFTEKIKTVVKRMPEIMRTKSTSYDIELRAQDITPALVRSLDLLEPFGPGNERPIFCLRDLKVSNVDYLKEVHVRWNFESATAPQYKLKGISFNYLGKWGRIHPNDFLRPGKFAQQTATAYFTLGVNRFNGNEFIQLMVDKVE